MSDQTKITYIIEGVKKKLVATEQGPAEIEVPDNTRYDVVLTGEGLKDIVAAQEATGLAGEALVAAVLEGAKGEVYLVERYLGNSVFDIANDGPNGEPAYQRFDEQGNEVHTARFQYGARNDGVSGEPAVLSKGKGSAQRIERYQNGKRNDGPNGEPAIEATNQAGKVYKIEHYKGGRSHNGLNDEPAVILMDEDATRLRSVVRYSEGQLCNGANGEPARELYSDKKHNCGQLVRAWGVYADGDKLRVGEWSRAEIEAYKQRAAETSKKAQTLQFQP